MGRFTDFGDSSSIKQGVIARLGDTAERPLRTEKGHRRAPDTFSEDGVVREPQRYCQRLPEKWHGSMGS